MDKSFKHFKAQWGIAFHGKSNFKKDFIAKTGTKYLKNARFERLSLGIQGSGLPPVRLVPLTLRKTNVSKPKSYLNFKITNLQDVRNWTPSEQ